MRPEKIDIELQTILTVHGLGQGGGVHLTPSMVLDALESDGFTLETGDINAVSNHVSCVRSAALNVMWRNEKDLQGGQIF